jgi:ERCC4-related helicase
LDGGTIIDAGSIGGLPIPPGQLLPFFLGARSAANPSAELLSEALCSSYEAFRHTRAERDLDKDDDAEPVSQVDLSQSQWYLEEFDKALESTQGSTHPKIHATVQKAVDLWESGEKVLVFAFYRRTCRALRIHISKEIERRLAGSHRGKVESVQKRFFDDSRAPGWKALDTALRHIVEAQSVPLDSAKVMPGQREDLVSVMRRFLRSETTLARCFPFAEHLEVEAAEAVELMLTRQDSSNRSWREKFNAFIDFLVECSPAERENYLEVASSIQTGGIRVEDAEQVETKGGSVVTVANVQVATGKTGSDTRERLMRAFNTPFLPDILVCSEVMGEGVDLQRACRHVIHHDLAWNPSTIEQRTGRIDRLGCKAEGWQSIVVYLPYLAGTADERQYQVMSHREQWFRVVMGQEEVARLITPESSTTLKLPDVVSNDLAFKLAL